MNKLFDHDKLQPSGSPLQLLNFNFAARVSALACCTRVHNPTHKAVFQQPKRGSIFRVAHLPVAQPVVARLPKGADDRQDFEEGGTETNDKGSRRVSEKNTDTTKGLWRLHEYREGRGEVAWSSFDIYFFPPIYFSPFFFLFRMNFLSNPRRTRILFPFFAHFARFFNSSDISWLVRMLIFGNQ